MTDRNLNRLMAKSIGWETADPNGVATWFDAEGKFTGYLTRKPADTKHALYDLPVWQPETRIEQAMMVLDSYEYLLERNETHGVVTYYCEIHLPSMACARAHSTNREEAICLAVEAALKEEKDVG